MTKEEHSTHVRELRCCCLKNQQVKDDERIAEILQAKVLSGESKQSDNSPSYLFSAIIKDDTVILATMHSRKQKLTCDKGRHLYPLNIHTNFKSTWISAIQLC
jgi:hypothetical protein